MQRARTFAVVVSVLSFAVAARSAHAQTSPLQYQTVVYDHDTGLVSNTSDQTRTVISFPVIVSGAEWLRLYFDTIELGDAVLRVTSYRDGDVQELRARHCVEWQNSTCYFNGNAAQVEVEAPPHSGPFRLALGRVDAGQLFVVPESLCGADNRALSNDPRVGRMMPPPPCTAWIINDRNRGMLTAGHCFAGGPALTLVQFNVPLSDAFGTPGMPSADDQYMIDPASIPTTHWSASGIGDDWAYFGVFANPNTTLSAGYAQGWAFSIEAPPSPAGNSIRVMGYGSDTPPHNYVQQSHVGPLTGVVGTTVRYVADDASGNSGSPLINATTGKSVGIQTHGGCDTVGYNSGTASTQPLLQTALASPQGVCREPKLVAWDGAAGDGLGESVAVCGDTVVVGSPGDDDHGLSAGSVYVFVRDGTGWLDLGKLMASDGASFDLFGAAVAVNGDTIVVGAASNGNASGSAYVFDRSGGPWVQQAKLTASDAAAGDGFGGAVSVNGDTIVVSASGDDDNGSGSGSAYVFVRNGAIWSQQAKLLANDGAPVDGFGSAVSLSGDTICVGANHDDDNGLDCGSAYVFVRNGSTWSQQAKLLGNDTAATDAFGQSVCVSGETAIVGAQGNDDSGSESGSAYVFVRSGSSWSQQAKLLASDGAAVDVFGYSVSLSGDTAVVGAYLDDNNGFETGSAYVFVRDGATWSQRAKLLASDGAAGDFFGLAVAVSGDTAVAGAYGDGVNLTGAAYTFTVTNTYATIYCTAEANTQGCLPSMRFSGMPSMTAASPFKLIATSLLNNKTGQFFYGKTGRNSAPFHGGTLCVAGPHRRGTVQPTGGNVSGTDCSGKLSFDFNEWLRTGHDPSVQPGTTINAQFWYRDPADTTNGVGSTNAVEFTVLP